MPGDKLNGSVDLLAQALRRVVREAVEEGTVPLRGDVAALKEDVAAVKEDLAEFKAETAENFAGVEKNFAEVRGEVAQLQHDKKWSGKTPAE